MAVLEREMADDAIVVADTGYSTAWAGALAEASRPAALPPRRRLARLGVPGRAGRAARGAGPQVISITGDGGFGYHIGDIETAIRLELPVIVVILNNQTLAFEDHVQDLLYGNVVPTVNDFYDVDYGAIARAFGANGFRVNERRWTSSGPSSVGLERRGPTIIDAVIDRDAIAPVTRYDRVRDREL